MPFPCDYFPKPYFILFACERLLPCRHLPFQALQHNFLKPLWVILLELYVVIRLLRVVPLVVEFQARFPLDGCCWGLPSVLRGHILRVTVVAALLVRQLAYLIGELLDFP